MKNISSYSMPELLEIKGIIENENLRNQLYQEIKRRESNRTIDLEKYSSGRLPEFYEEYQEQCLRLLSELNYMDLSFLLNSGMFAAGNNYGGDFRFRTETKYKEKYQYNLHRSTIQGLDHYFVDHPEAIYYYEGLYNTLNYIKTSISILLHLKGDIESKEELFLDFKEKKYLVTKNLKDISEQLFNLRNKVPDSRLCVGNQSLSRNIHKYGENITGPQDRFISSIAFGSTLEKLNAGNYEEAERLLFVPQCKMLKK